MTEKTYWENKCIRLENDIAALTDELASMKEGRHSCPTCDCPMYHRAKSPAGWYCPECELHSLRFRIEVEGMAKVLDAACRKWSKGARGMNAFEAEARALCAYLLGKEKTIEGDSYPDSAACLDGKYGPRR